MATIGGSAGTLTDSSEKLMGVSEKLKSNAEMTSEQANQASVAAEEINSIVQTVASGPKRCPPASGKFQETPTAPWTSPKVL